MYPTSGVDYSHNGESPKSLLTPTKANKSIYLLTNLSI